MGMNERLASRALIGTIVVVSLLTGCHTRRLQDERDAALAAEVRGFTARLSAQDEFSGAVLLARNGSPLTRSSFGLANRETGRSNTPETPFMLSSVRRCSPQWRLLNWWNESRWRLKAS